MKIKLDLPKAEIYNLKFSHNFRKKELDRYVERQLKIMQPGFNNESLWDYVITKSGSDKKIKAVVLDKNFYIEERLKHRNTLYYIEENNKNYFLFRNKNFSKTGKKKNQKIWMILFLVICLFLLLILFGYAKSQKGKKVNQIEDNSVQVKEIEIPKLFNVFDLFNFIAKKIYENDGTINSIQYILQQNAELKIVITGCNPYDLIKEIIDYKNIISCECESVAYNNSVESYELKIVFQLPALFIVQKSNLDLLEIQKTISSELISKNIKILSSSINQDFCKVGFLLTAERKNLENINSYIEEYLFTNNFFISNFKEENDSKNNVIIEIEIMSIDDKQLIESAVEAEYLGKALFEIKNIQNNSVQKEVYIPVNSINGYTKIGSVINDGKTFFYYKTDDGKLFISEKEL